VALVRRTDVSEEHIAFILLDYEDYEEEREVGSTERHYGWGGTEYIIGFEGSQALPVCPSGNCKLLTGAIEI
jgi:hypothetical protein